MTVQSNNKSVKDTGKKSILLAVIALVESVFLLVSFTFSWFEGGTALNLLGRDIVTESVLYSAFEVGEGSEYQQVISLNNYFSGQNKAKFNPVSSPDGKTFYTMYHGDVSAFHADSSSVKWRKLTTEDVNSSILKFQFQVSSPTADCYFWFKQLPTITLNGDASSGLSKAFRIHFDDGSNSVTATTASSWYGEYNGTAVESINASDHAVISSDSTVQFANDTLYNDATYNTKYLFYCGEGETVTVTCSVWLEATDPLAQQIVPGSDVSVDVQISSSFSQMTLIQVSTAINSADNSDNTVEILHGEGTLSAEETEETEESSTDEPSEDVIEESAEEANASEVLEETEETSSSDESVVADNLFNEEEIAAEGERSEDGEQLLEGTGSVNKLFANANAQGETMVLDLYNADLPDGEEACIYTAEYVADDNCWIAQVPVAWQNIKLVYHKEGNLSAVEGEWLATERGTNNVYVLIDNETGVWALPSDSGSETETEVSENVSSESAEESADATSESINEESSEILSEEATEEVSEEVSEEMSEEGSDDTEITENSEDTSEEDTSEEYETSDVLSDVEKELSEDVFEESAESSELLQELSQEETDVAGGETSTDLSNDISA